LEEDASVRDRGTIASRKKVVSGMNRNCAIQSTPTAIAN
jgi:hypothetical protein